jgi:hypothetical protein
VDEEAHLVLLDAHAVANFNVADRGELLKFVSEDRPPPPRDRQR